MKDYFQLQYIMTNRKLSELGIHPLLGYLGGLLLFVLGAEYIFYKTEFAKYILMLMAFGIIMNLSEIRRTDFLKIVFGLQQSRKIRMTENGVITIPFAVVLLFHQAYVESALLGLAGVAFAWLFFRNTFSYALPTPFSKDPFEFTVGFRNTFYVIAAAYALTVIAVSVGNFNLGVFALLLVYVVSLTFYLKPEHEYYVWTYATTAKKFLLDKIRIATLNAGLLALPIVGVLLYFYAQYALIIFVCVLIGTAFLWTIILAKYGAYPYEMNLPQGILLAICIVFPPLLLAVIPFFYSKAVQKMKLLLA